MPAASSAARRLVPSFPFLLVVLAASCSEKSSTGVDTGTGPDSVGTAATPTVLLEVPVRNMRLGKVVADVSASDLTTFSVALDIVSDTASATLEIPAGPDRLILVHGYNAQGVEQYRGQKTITVTEGTNPTLFIGLTPWSASGQYYALPIIGTFHDLYDDSYSFDGPGLFLSAASFQHSTPWTNADMVQYSALPRTAIVNDASDQLSYYTNVGHVWYGAYRVLQDVGAGLSRVDDLESEGGIDPDEAAMWRAYGRFMQGLAYARVAVLYDRGWLLDSGTLAPYGTVMDTALVRFDQAIAVATGASITIPEREIPHPGGVRAATLVRIAHSMKARYRAAVARTPAERAAVDWPAVIADVDAGVTGDWALNVAVSTDWYPEVVDYATYQPWSEAAYWIVGMADQSGDYQKWLAAGLDGMRPTLADSTDVLIITPDLRFPRGATIAEQQASPGSLYKIPDASVDGWRISEAWAHPEQGMWRWSYYWPYEFEDFSLGLTRTHNEIDRAEMRLLKAEGLYRRGDLAGAAVLINVSREAAGLGPADANGTNADCVPRLPDGSCGGLFEMLKWEKRMQVRLEGLFGAPWYFDARGWGDLYRGTFLQLPVPCSDLLLLGETCYTFGGGEPSSAPASTYHWPGEG